MQINSIIHLRFKPQLTTAHLSLVVIFCATLFWLWFYNVIEHCSPPHRYCFCKYRGLLVHHLPKAFCLPVHVLHVRGHGWKVQYDGRTAVRWNGSFICWRDLLTGSELGARCKNNKPLLLSLLQTLFSLDIRKPEHPSFAYHPSFIGHQYWVMTFD